MGSFRSRSRSSYFAAACQERAAPALGSGSLAGWLSHSLEALWLIAVGLVPLVFGPPDYQAFFDIPKVALLRLVSALMLMIIALEWAISPRRAGWPKGVFSWGQFRSWIGQQPLRWVIVAATLYLLVTGLAALLSPLRPIGLLGYEPGRDGYSLYNVACYYVLFLVIASRLSNPAKMWRLVAVVVFVGIVGGGYALIQRFGLDPLDLWSLAGKRAISTFGNPIFLGSALLLTLLLSLAMATALWERFRFPVALVAGGVMVWMPLLGLSLALARGPWVGTGVALLLFLGLLVLAMGRIIAIRASSILAAASVLTATTLAILPTAGSGAALGATGFADVTSRLSTISPQVSGGGFSGRVAIWKASGTLIRDRPWFRSQPQRLWPLRHLVGYGPDTFAMVYPLKEEPPLNPAVSLNNSAHNMIVHAAVETGLLGVIALAGVLGTALVAGGMVLWRGRGAYPAPLRLFFVAVLATLVGRTIEQMVGIAQISDLTLFWALCGLLVGLPMVALRTTVGPRVQPNASVEIARRRMARGGLTVARIIIAGLAVVLLGAFTWAKTVNYVLASSVSAASGRALDQGNVQTSVQLAKRAIELAPDVAAYRLNLANIFRAVGRTQVRDEERMALERESLRVLEEGLGINPLSLPLVAKAAETNLELVHLGLTERSQAAVRQFQELATLLPNHWQLQMLLAIAYLNTGDPDRALVELEGVLSRLGTSPFSAEPLYLQALAYRELGLIDEAIASLELALVRVPEGKRSTHARQELERLRSSRGGPIPVDRGP